MTLVHDISDIASAPASAAVRCTLIEAAAESPMRPPPFLLGPANESVLWQLFGQTTTPAVNCYSIEDVLVAPRGIAIKDGVALHAAAFLQPRHHVVDVCDRLNTLALPQRHVAGPLAVIYGPGHETWGHWLTDFLPRLWVLSQAGYDIAALRFLVPPDIRPFALDLLRLCGVSDAQLVAYDYWSEIIHTSQLLLPTTVRQQNRLAPCFAQATAFWVQRAAPAMPAHGPNAQLFISRAAAQGARTLHNRGEIEALAEQAGLRVIHPENMGISEQISAFRQARLVVGEYGSALHNSVFAPAGALACGLRGTSRHPDFVQSGIATALDQHAAYMLMDTAGQDIVQNFTLDTGLFRRGLEMAQLWAG